MGPEHSGKNRNPPQAMHSRLVPEAPTSDNRGMPMRRRCCFFSLLSDHRRCRLLCSAANDACGEKEAVSWL
ncbi:hypothetical protein SDC9_122355 [bioreactor metagenome]|uniref:Uncharacterized protein n=1 Tax=bioreactor metagenome TaxID=1076179 RepID=A0A645CEN4_9ZZZZ